MGMLVIQNQDVFNQDSRINSYHQDPYFLFDFSVYKFGIKVGIITIFKHESEAKAGILHLEIAKRYQKRWLDRTVAKEMNATLDALSKEYNLNIIYSEALTEVSPKLLKFFDFKKKEDSKYYYREI